VEQQPAEGGAVGGGGEIETQGVVPVLPGAEALGGLGRGGKKLAEMRGDDGIGDGFEAGEESIIDGGGKKFIQIARDPIGQMMGVIEQSMEMRGALLGGGGEVCARFERCELAGE